jgi:hypothetical protein
MTKEVDPFTGWHVGVAAEAVAAGLFARCGLDVSVQYGANQPEYDLMIANGDNILKVSVKGSKDGGWGLTQSHLPKQQGALKETPDYHAAIDRWLSKHGNKTIFCFVQFERVAINELPRVYLASPTEIAEAMHKTAKGRGGTILYERKVWTDKAQASGTVDEIPSIWRFTAARVEHFLKFTQPLAIGAVDV